VRSQALTESRAKHRPLALVRQRLPDVLVAQIDPLKAEAGEGDAGVIVVGKLADMKSAGAVENALFTLDSAEDGGGIVGGTRTPLVVRATVERRRRKNQGRFAIPTQGVSPLASNDEHASVRLEVGVTTGPANRTGPVVSCRSPSQACETLVWAWGTLAPKADDPPSRTVPPNSSSKL